MGVAAAVGAMSATAIGSAQIEQSVVEYETAVEYLTHGEAKTLDEYAAAKWDKDPLGATMAVGGILGWGTRGARKAWRYPWAL